VPLAVQAQRAGEPPAYPTHEVNDRLGRIMRKAFGEVSGRATECGIPMRLAAYELGIERVVEASRTRGYIS
jgi:glutamate dehydrogenase/leucine dehydrogenase